MGRGKCPSVWDGIDLYFRLQESSRTDCGNVGGISLIQITSIVLRRLTTETGEHIREDQTVSAFSRLRRSDVDPPSTTEA